MRRNRIIWYLLFLATYIYAANIGGTISYLLLYMVCFIPLLSAAYLLFVYFRFRIYQHLDRRVMVKGDHIAYEFHLANEDFIAFTDVQVTFAKQTSSVEDISPETCYCLLPGEEVKKETTLCCHYRGEYFIGIDYVIVRDFFRLFEVKYSNKSRIEVQVMPRVLHLERLEVGPNEENLKTNLLGSNSPQVVRDNELRKYQPGDSMRLIHWKATARNQTLLCQKYIAEPKTGVLTLLDLSEQEGDEFQRIVTQDKMLEAVLAIHDYFYRHSIPSKVVYADSKVHRKTIQTRQDFEEFYSICKSITFHTEVSLLELLKRAVLLAEDIGYLIILTAKLEDEICVACNEAVHNGFDLTIIYVGDSDLALQKPLLEERIHLHNIRLEMEVEDVLSNRRSSA